jgi:predicted MPP superfamily phosphohydrolase
MKAARVLLFFGIVIAVYSSVIAYILYRGVHCFPPGTAARTIVLWIGLFLVLSYLVGRVLERYWLSPVSDLFVWIGSFWFGAMHYFFLALVVIDLVRLVHALFPFLPDFDYRPEQTSEYCSGLWRPWSVTMIAGYLNARHPSASSHCMSEGCRRSDSAPALASTSTFARSSAKRPDGIANTIENLHPDLVLFPGDLVDEDLAPVIKENLGETLRSIKAPLGVFGITGNHEYIGGAEEAVAYLEEHGVRMLRDTCVVLDGGITLCGREDRSITQFAGKNRKPLDVLLKDVDQNRPVIMMDHQPFDLDSVARAGVDLQISGHTHHGQIWPLNYITGMVYEQSWGYLQKRDTHFYVSSGVGTWGPPMRLGNRPEIVVLTLTFDNR